MTKTIKSGVVKAGSGLFGYPSPVSSSFFVMNVFFSNVRSKQTSGLVLRFERDYVTYLEVFLSKSLGSPKHSNDAGHRFLPRRFYTKLTQ
jgi:hypothetical protein